MGHSKRLTSAKNRREQWQQMYCHQSRVNWFLSKKSYCPGLTLLLVLMWDDKVSLWEDKWGQWQRHGDLALGYQWPSGDTYDRRIPWFQTVVDSGKLWIKGLMAGVGGLLDMGFATNRSQAIISPPKLWVSRALKSTQPQNSTEIFYKPAGERSFFILFNFLAFFLPSETGSAQDSVCSSSASEISPDTLASKSASAGLGLRLLFSTAPVAVRLKHTQWNDMKGVESNRNTSL